jgi:hypothetical protein
MGSFSTGVMADAEYTCSSVEQYKIFPDDKVAMV